MPKGIERDYMRALIRIVNETRAAYQPALELLPSLLASAALEQRADAGEGSRMRAMLAAIRERLGAIVRPARVEALAGSIASRASSHNKAQLGRQIRSAFGVDLFATEPHLVPIVEGFITENVALITNMPSDMAARIEAITSRALANGTLHKDVAKEIQNVWAIGRNRARLIATDQLGKVYGKINAKRQTALGVRRFVWRTAQDRRVRGTPGGAFPNAKPSHFKREGVVFSYDDKRFSSPDDGIPGVPVRCRCYAEPVFDDLLAGV